MANVSFFSYTISDIRQKPLFYGGLTLFVLSVLAVCTDFSLTSSHYYFCGYGIIPLAIISLYLLHKNKASSNTSMPPLQQTSSSEESHSTTSTSTPAREVMTSSMKPFLLTHESAHTYADLLERLTHESAHAYADIVLKESADVIPFFRSDYNSENLGNVDIRPLIAIYLIKLRELKALQKNTLSSFLVDTYTELWKNHDIVMKARELFAISYVISNHYILNKKLQNSMQLCNLAYRIIREAAVVQDKLQFKTCPNHDREKHAARFFSHGDLEDIRVLFNLYCSSFSKVAPEYELPQDLGINSFLRSPN